MSKTAFPHGYGYIRPGEIFHPNNELAKIIRDQFPPDYRGWAIDVGASDGYQVNSTWLLEKAYQWMVLSVEPNPTFFKKLKEERIWTENCACDSNPVMEEGATVDFHVHLDNMEAFSSLRPKRPVGKEAELGSNWAKIKVRVTTINDLLEKWQFPKLDALCVDVEGSEVDVLKGCDLSFWKPKVIVAESWEEKGMVDDYLQNCGYEFKERLVENNIYIRRES